MKPKDIADAILSIAPNAEFTFQECDLETLEWHSKSTKPTNQQILAAIQNNQVAKEAEEATKAAEKAALLAKLGITADEAKLLLS